MRNATWIATILALLGPMSAPAQTVMTVGFYDAAVIVQAPATAPTAVAESRGLN